MRLCQPTRNGSWKTKSASKHRAFQPSSVNAEQLVAPQQFQWVPRQLPFLGSILLASAAPGKPFFRPRPVSARPTRVAPTSANNAEVARRHPADGWRYDRGSRFRRSPTGTAARRGSEVPGSQSCSAGEIDPEPVAPALIAAGHFRRGVAEMLLDVTFVDLGRRGEAGAQRVPGEFLKPLALGESPRTPAASARRLTRRAT